ncbi:lactonase family protein [Roseomonas haemaphysalidis]|uniref:Beta-propeller fold lactonase family protein n=1 Tax=Roseomonas haemaphysalidis TaxID=2768162 RepID=A0ABS3KQK1_9PROT|nr:beta-propeller fold lactonase family protein [Roseomonas haemaphysalidis]MBO1079707.1 beta-propeller fold lactonase family protein [Roseomonas haemaphysalidis]
MSDQGDVPALLYVAIGPRLVPHVADAAAMVLEALPGVSLPAAVQYAWFHPRLPLLYAAYSNRAVPGGDDTHGVAAFRIDPRDGTLAPFGPPVPLGNRPIHVTLDPQGHWLLLTCNSPAQVVVHRLQPDGAIGPAVVQGADLRLGSYPHQARVLPGGGQVVVSCRGSDATADRPADPGALVLLDLADGRLTWRQAVTEGDGLLFGPRHVDLHPTRPWMYVSLERGNRLLAYGPGAPAAFAAADTVPDGAGRLAPEQYAGAVHLHPGGRHVYVANRSDGTVPFQGTMVHGEGQNSIACFAIDPDTGVPGLREVVDTRGIHCRSFAIHPGGGMLVAGSVAPLAVRRDNAVQAVAAGLSVFAVSGEGCLSFQRKYDTAPEAGAVFWCGFRPTE